MGCASLLGLAVTGCGDDSPSSSGAGGAGTGGEVASGGAGGAGAAGGDTGGAGAAGGGGAVDHGTFGSGTRLRAVYLDAGGGALAFQHFHDVDLDIDCTFLPHADGAYRCLPNVLSDSLFADAACTMPLAPVPGGACGASVGDVAAVVADRGGCTSSTSGGSSSNVPTAYRARAVGEEVSPDAVFYLDADGACVAGTVSPTVSYFPIGEEVPASSFVGGEREGELFEERAEVGTLRGDDGSYVLESTRDITLDVDCRFEDDQCLPPFRAEVGGAHSDAACAVPIGESWKDDLCPDPMFIRQTVPPATTCGASTSAYHAVGAELDPAELYGGDPASCHFPLSAVYGNGVDKLRFFEVGAALPEGTFFATKPVSRGTERVRVSRTGLPSGEVLDQTARFVDTSLDVPCHPARFVDGELRCLPDDALELPDDPISFYSDDACTKPVRHRAEGCPLPLPAYFYSATEQSVCIEELGYLDREVETLVPATDYTGPVYSIHASPRGCFPATPPPSYHLFELGEAVGLDELVSLSVSTD